MTERLQQLVEQVVREQPVPGAVAGVFNGTTTAVASAGVADLGSGQPMTRDTLFLFGSVTKVWLTTLVMSLVDDGLLDLDAPVTRYLPDLRLGDADAADHVTLRMLLSHSSGIDAADLIVDLGDDDDAISRYVGRLADRGQLHPAGELASYNNAGFVLAGRVVEVVTGQTYADALRTRLIEPLGLARTCHAPVQGRPDNSAIGHFPGAGGLTPAATFLLPRALAPAGATLLVTAADALEFARLHLSGGLTTTGSRLLTAEAAAAMQVPHHEWPAPGTGSIALGWWRQEADDGQVVVSHSGGSLGGSAMLALVPDRGVAVVAYVNSTASGVALPLIVQAMLAELGVPLGPPGPRPFDAMVDPARFVGSYRRYGMTVDVRRVADHLELAMKPELDTVVEYLTGQPTTLTCRPVDERCLAVDVGDPASGPPAAWLVRHGHDIYLYLGGRLARREGAREAPSPPRRP